MNNKDSPVNVSITQVDFSQTPLAANYSSFYAKVVDGLFTPADCARLQALASDKDSCPDGWLPAGMNDNNGTKTVHSNFRNSDRALVWNKEMADFLYEKIRPHVEELHEIRPDGEWAGIAGRIGKKQGPTWILSEVNHRLSFLRYGAGHYFKPHCDGLNDFDGKKSFVTIHIYLNDSVDADKPVLDCSGVVLTDSSVPSSVPLPGADSDVSETQPAEASVDEAPHSTSTEPLVGGSTRFWSTDKKAFIDVFPKIGRVLIFQQRMLLHSGEAVTSGTKYTVRSDFMFVQK